MLPGFDDIAVLGDVFCDIIIRGVDRLPDWGEEVFGVEPAMCPGGVANVAVGLARLGVQAHLLARTRASDRLGDIIVGELDREANLTYEALTSAPSTSITVAIPAGSERAMISYEPPSDDRPVIDAIPWDRLGRISHLHLGSWSEGVDPFEDQRAVLDAARDRGVTTSIDVSLGEASSTRRGDLLELISHADLFMPNTAEACRLADRSSAADALEFLVDIVPTVVVKRGPDGAIAGRPGERANCDGTPTTVVDTTGAGDAFAAGFLHGFARHWPLERALRLANACGALSVSRIGSSISTPTRAEVYAALGSPDEDLKYGQPKR